MTNKQFLNIIIRLSLIALNGVFIFVSFAHSYLINGFGAILLLCFQIFLFYDYINKKFLDVEKSVDCLLHDDYQNTISKEKRKNSLHNKIALLLDKHRAQSLQKTSETVIFTNIIESLSIGLLILRRKTENEIEIFQINNAFTNFLKIPKFFHWELLQKRIPAFTSLLEAWKTSRHTISLEIQEQTEDFFLKTSLTQTNEYEYLVVSLETIQQLIDKKEKEAWYKLMNVMSHEIINTITPISSLAENLNSLLQEEEQPDAETLDELSQGLQIIKKRSHHLTSFVESYRKLAELPLPQKTSLDLTALVSQTLSLFEQQFTAKQITVEFNAEKSYLIVADKEQIEQVIINLLSNCVYALQTIENPKIQISIFQENQRTHLKIGDNGIGISDEIKNNIFIPYFTTRKNGSGIGLTLTKSIIEAHGGIIRFQSQEHETVFTISFIN